MNRKTMLIITTILLLALIVFVPKGDPGSVSFRNDFAEAGVPLEVEVSGYPAGTRFVYQWAVGGRVLEETGSSYTPSEEDLEKFITVTVTPSGSFETVSLSMYFSRLPVLYLSAEEEVKREDYTAGRMDLQGNHMYSKENELYSGAVQIRYRGNSTWMDYPKNPYKIKLEEPADLFGMGKNRHWVLLANYADESLMRNKLAYDLSGMMGMPYMESTWVSVVFDGEYIGNYLLCEQIRIAKERVNILDLTHYAKTVAKSLVKAEVFEKEEKQKLEDMLEQDLSWLSTGTFVLEEQEYDLSPYLTLPELTGGFLMEIDGYFDEPSKMEVCGLPLMFKNPRYACTNTEIMEYVNEYFSAAFDAMLNSEDFYSVFRGEEKSYTELFDIHSLAQYVLLQEIFFNYDGVSKSNFLYMDQDSKAYMGPVWDLDWSSGRDSGEMSPEEWWTLAMAGSTDKTVWYSGVIRDPYFLSVMMEVWESCYENIAEMTEKGGTIDQAYAYLYESGRVNEELWRYKEGFMDAGRHLKEWMTARIQWLEEQFASLDTLVQSINVYQADKTIQLQLEDRTLHIQSEIGSTAVIYWNSVRCESLELENQTAFWELPAKQEWEESDVLLVRLYDEEGRLIGSNYIDGRK